MIYGLAGWPKETQPWEPPMEAEAMTGRQRQAVTALIRAFVQPALHADQPSGGGGYSLGSDTGSDTGG